MFPPIYSDWSRQEFWIFSLKQMRRRARFIYIRLFTESSIDNQRKRRVVLFCCDIAIVDGLTTEKNRRLGLKRSVRDLRLQSALWIAAWCVRDERASSQRNDDDEFCGRHNERRTQMIINPSLYFYRYTTSDCTIENRSIDSNTGEAHLRWDEGVRV